MTEESVAKPGTSRGKTNQSNSKKEAIRDYKTCILSREASLMARREVLTGKAKFGIIGDGKELPQVALAKVFDKGDWRSGYYRDQTIMFSLGILELEAFFAQLYADSDNDPFSGGRQMNCHFATPNVGENGELKDVMDQYNISSDISSTGGQMARALGLALASKKYRQLNKSLPGKKFSNKGNEVCFATIGDASTSEGVFWETLNAAGVLQVPLVVSVWDDDYGISVPKEYQTVKQSISKALKGFQRDDKDPGIDIYNVKGWDYEALCEVYEKAVAKTRKTHIPALIHVEELTQPQGHSTSGSHERYKSKDRLQWEREHDCLLKMRKYIIASGFATKKEIEKMEAEAKASVIAAKNKAWSQFVEPVKKDLAWLIGIYETFSTSYPEHAAAFADLTRELKMLTNPTLSELTQNAKRARFLILEKKSEAIHELNNWLTKVKMLAQDRYHTNLYNETATSALKVPVVPAAFSDESIKLNGYQILNKFFDFALKNYPNLFAFGEDVGHIGDVNQGFAGLQDKYGVDRVFDTGIREWTIMGQAIGMSMRGLRPIAEIQYLDYLIYGLEPLSDDLATLHYRSDGIQMAPAIIRTRGHRLEGIWHAGSPLGMMINSLRGMHICVPRNMTQAVGFYNTLLKANDPAIVIECLNGYRLKEKLPDNMENFTVPLGVPEVLQQGADVTLVTYGSCVRVAQKGVELLAQKGISVELIDVQTLLPFDLEHHIVESLKKTNRIVFMDEDVPGGATSFMMQEVLEKQGGYGYLDSAPITLSAHPHRTPFGSDGDYFTKPNPEDVFETVYELIKEAEPQRFL